MNNRPKQLLFGDIIVLLSIIALVIFLAVAGVKILKLEKENARLKAQNENLMNAFIIDSISAQRDSIQVNVDSTELKTQNQR